MPAANRHKVLQPLALQVPTRGKDLRTSVSAAHSHSRMEKEVARRSSVCSPCATNLCISPFCILLPGFVKTFGRKNFNRGKGKNKGGGAVQWDPYMGSPAPKKQKQGGGVEEQIQGFRAAYKR